MQAVPLSPREAFLRDGYLVFPEFFSPEELRPVNAALDALLAERHPSSDELRPAHWKQFGSDVAGYGGKANERPEVKALQASARLQQLTLEVLGGAFEDENLLVQVTRSGSGQAWHQDTPVQTPERFNVNRLIYTRDVSPERGQVVVVPGSHRRGRIPRGGNQESMEGEVALAPRAGTLVFLHSLCFHRVTLNHTAEPRVSVNFRIRPAGCPSGMGRHGVYRNGTYDFRTNEVLAT